MIDWWNLAFNACWILGASILLAAFSYYHWVAGETKQTLSQVHASSSWRLYNQIGMVFVCVGWTLAQADRWWEKALWGVLTANFTWQLIVVARETRRANASGEVREDELS